MAVDALDTIAEDPVLFAETFFPFPEYTDSTGTARSGPYEYQERFWRSFAYHAPGECLPTYTDKCDGTPHKRGVLLWGRQSGKTTSVAIFAIWFCLTHAGTLITPTQVLITSVGVNTSMVMFRAIRSLVESHPLLAPAVVGPDPHGRATRTEIWFSNNSRIAVRPLGHTGATARGLATHLLIVDEAAFVKEDIFTGVLFPQLAATNGSLILLSTPFGKDHVFYRCFTNRDYWVKVIKSRDCPKISAEILDEAQRLDPLTFRREYDVEFLDEESAWFPTSLLRERVTDDFAQIPETDILLGKHYDGEFFLGGDFGKRGSHTAFGVFQRSVEVASGQERYRLVHEKQFPMVGEKDEETDIYRRALDYLLALGRAFPNMRGCLDSSNNESIVEQIRVSLPALEGINLSEPKVRDIMTNARNMMEQGRVRLPYWSPTLNELAAQRYEVGVKGTLHFPKPMLRDPKNPVITNDRLWACILGLYSVRTPVTPGRVTKI